VIVVGDIHGCIRQLEHLLKREGVLTKNLEWAAENNTLVFVGDYTDRGEDGIACLELVMGLEVEADKRGGQVFALLGNHDMLLLGAKKFGDEPVPNERPVGVGRSLLEQWQTNGGGKLSDLERLQSRHIQWLEQRPTMLLLEESLIVHADTLNYLEYGPNIQEINTCIQTILQGNDIRAYDRLDEKFADRHAFSGVDGITRARQFLKTFGGSHIIHGHTPIAKVTGQDSKTVTEALEYADKLCINVDHGLYLGSEGFCYRVP
jgi:3',5'-cyclic AMP phosphodiesterase CpdA